MFARGETFYQVQCLNKKRLSEREREASADSKD